MNNDIAIKLESVSKYFQLYSKPRDRIQEALSPFRKTYHKKFHVLKDINFEAKRGEIVGIVGKNGSGKSTLLKIISGVIQPSSGNVFVKGKLTAMLELGAGFNPEFTGIENIRFLCAIAGVKGSKRESMVDDVIDFSGIGEYINQPVKSYSNGMKARLGFAYATSSKPDLLIIDEVLSVGDLEFRHKCFDRISNFLESTCCLFVSHSSQQILRLCSSAILIENGSITKRGDVPSILEKYELSQQSGVHETYSLRKETICLSVNGRDVLNSLKVELNKDNRFELSYKIKIDSKQSADYRCVFTIRDSFESMLITLVSDRGEFQPIDDKAKNISFSLDDLRLKTGQYFLRATVVAARTGLPFAFREDIQLSINGDVSYTAPVRVKAKWS